MTIRLARPVVSRLLVAGGQAVVAADKRSERPRRWIPPQAAARGSVGSAREADTSGYCPGAVVAAAARLRPREYSHQAKSMAESSAVLCLQCVRCFRVFCFLGVGVPC